MLWSDLAKAVRKKPKIRNRSVHVYAMPNTYNRTRKKSFFSLANMRDGRLTKS